MKAQEWTFVDRTGWPRGAWDNEPDKAQWIDEATGLPCLAVRGRSHWCGYVGVAEGHPWFGVGYSSCYKRPPCDKGAWCEHSPDSVLKVHGGLTFADRCQDEGKEHGVCHIVEPGDPDPVWWFGFDCHHDGDFAPRKLSGKEFLDLYYSYGIYRDLGYDKRQCAGLARQLNERAS